MISLLGMLMLSGAVLGARLDYLPPVAGGGGHHGGSFASGASFGAAGASFSSGPFIPITRYDNKPNQGDGSYSYNYETGNGIRVQEAGHQTGPESQTASGSYSYTGPDGRVYTVNYIADEYGFRATGDHLPTPPPIPPEIQKSLALNAAAATHGGSFAAGGHHSGGGSYSSSSGYHYKK